MAKTTEPVIINQFNMGGLSDSLYLGGKNTLYKMVGVDVHKDVGLLQLSQALVDVSGVVNEYVKVMIAVSDGSILAFSSTSGKIWRYSSGSWTLVYTTTTTDSKVFTITIADPGVATSTAHNLLTGDKVEFSTTGALPTGLNVDTPYYVIKIDANTFNLATSYANAIAGTKIETTGSQSGVHTLRFVEGEVKCLGAKEYNDYIYWATSIKLHRIALSGIEDWDANAVPNWQRFSISETEYRPMQVQNGNLYIGNGQYVAALEVTDFTEDALDIPKPNRISVLANYDTDLLIGTTIDGKVNQSMVLRWNTWSVSWSTDYTIKETCINAFIPVWNNIFVQAGDRGNIYYFDGQRLDLYRQIPGDYTSAKKAKVNENAVSEYDSQSVFGLSNVLGNPTETGVYMLGSRNPQFYPRVLTMPYVLSNGLTSGNEIGAIVVSGQDMYISWKNSTSYGIDMIDMSNKHDQGYIQTRIIYSGVETTVNWGRIVLQYNILPGLTDVKLYTKTENDADWVEQTLKNDTAHNYLVCDQRQTSNRIEVKVVLYSSVNLTPQLLNLIIYL